MSTHKPVFGYIDDVSSYCTPQSMQHSDQEHSNQVPCQFMHQPNRNDTWGQMTCIAADFGIIEESAPKTPWEVQYGTWLIDHDPFHSRSTPMSFIWSAAIIGIASFNYFPPRTWHWFICSWWSHELSVGMEFRGKVNKLYVVNIVKRRAALCAVICYGYFESTHRGKVTGVWGRGEK